MFGFCLNVDKIYFQDLINHAKNKGTIVQESQYAPLNDKEYVYLFYESLAPLSLNTGFLGKVEIKGWYPFPDAPYGYLFYPESKLNFYALMIDPSGDYPDLVVLNFKSYNNRAWKQALSFSFIYLKLLIFTKNFHYYLTP